MNVIETEELRKVLEPYFWPRMVSDLLMMRLIDLIDQRIQQARDEVLDELADIVQALQDAASERPIQAYEADSC